MSDLLDKTILQHNAALQNISAIDRFARALIGMLLISICFVVDVSTANAWTMLLPLIGIVPLLSGIMGWCPIYALFHTKSCGLDSHNDCGTFLHQLHKLFS